MSRTLGFKTAVAALSILAIAFTGSLTACSKKKETSLPPGTQLMSDGANAMSNVQSAHFVLTVDGAINGLALSRAEGDLTKDGKAKGTATIDQSGIKVEAAFVIVDQWLYLKLATGGYQKLPLAVAATVYDPSAILDPQRGVAQLLRTAKNPQTVAEEKVDGKDAYKVSFEPDPTALAALIPISASGVTATVWLYADSKKVAKGQFVIPTSGTAAGKGTVTVVFSNYDAPVNISAPQ